MSENTIGQNYCDDPKCPNRNPLNGLHYFAGDPRNKYNCSANTRPAPSPNKLGFALDQHIQRLGKELSERADDIMRLRKERTAHRTLTEELTRLLDEMYSHCTATTCDDSLAIKVKEALAKSRALLEGK